MGDKFEEAMSRLFSAKWNVPKAALHCGITWGECMEYFSDYCRDNPPIYDEHGDLIDCVDGGHPVNPPL